MKIFYSLVIGVALLFVGLAYAQRNDEINKTDGVEQTEAAGKLGKSTTPDALSSEEDRTQKISNTSTKAVSAERENVFDENLKPIDCCAAHTCCP